MKSDTRWLLFVLPMLWSQIPLASDGLGRLLTSPEERRLIAASLGNQVEEAEVQLVRFDGVMEVEQGRLAVWVNGRRIDQPRQLERRGMVLVARQAEPLHLAVLGEDGILHRLLPGQVFDRATGRILESWEVEETASAPDAGQAGESEGEPEGASSPSLDPASRELQHLLTSMEGAVSVPDAGRRAGKAGVAE